MLEKIALSFSQSSPFLSFPEPVQNILLTAMSPTYLLSSVVNTRHAHVAVATSRRCFYYCLHKYVLLGPMCTDRMADTRQGTVTMNIYIMANLNFIWFLLIPYPA